MSDLFSSAEWFFPNSRFPDPGAVTDLCIAAHQDDSEIMAYHPILEGYITPGRSFGTVILTDGASSPRSGDYASCSDEEMRTIRIQEQKEAARIGHYAFLGLLGHSSRAVKDPAEETVVREIADLLLRLRPRFVYTHNFADKHDTHAAAALRTLAALRSVRDSYRPEQFILLEVWRGLDWLCDGDKLLMDTAGEPELALRLLSVYRSQIQGGKDYGKAALGRRYANATFLESHSTDSFVSCSYGLDATELIGNDDSPREFILERIGRFADEVSDRLNRLS